MKPNSKTQKRIYLTLKTTIAATQHVPETASGMARQRGGAAESCEEQWCV